MDVGVWKIEVGVGNTGVAVPGGGVSAAVTVSPTPGVGVALPRPGGGVPAVTVATVGMGNVPPVTVTDGGGVTVGEATPGMGFVMVSEFFWQKSKPAATTKTAAIAANARAFTGFPSAGGLRSVSSAPSPLVRRTCSTERRSRVNALEHPVRERSPDPNPYDPKRPKAKEWVNEAVAHEEWPRRKETLMNKASVRKAGVKENRRPLTHLGIRYHSPTHKENKSESSETQ
jgi:hypothetical protein